MLAAAELAARAAGGTLEDLLPTVGRFGLGTTAVTNTLASRTGRHGRAAHHERASRGCSRFAKGTRVIDDEGWLAPPPEIVPQPLHRRHP